MGAIKNAPDMNIKNQINAALADVRETLMSLTEFAKTPDISDRIVARNQALYQLELAMIMIEEYRTGKASMPWSEMKGMVEEEFS